jgi:hypothetical protein
MAGKGPYDMTRDDKGVWTVTTHLPSGFHYYFLLVDGFQCNDPGSQTCFAGTPKPAPRGPGQSRFP